MTSLIFAEEYFTWVSLASPSKASKPRPPKTETETCQRRPRTTTPKTGRVPSVLLSPAVAVIPVVALLKSDQRSSQDIDSPPPANKEKMERDSFCQLILQKEPMQNLRIPPEFSELYHHELPDTVIFKGPSGNEWPAKLQKDIDFVCVQDDGWLNFYRDNALGNSEFLIFRYDGKKYFNVQVFDPTGVERLNVPSEHNPELEQNRLEKIQVEERLSELKEEGKDLPDVRMSSDPGKHKNMTKQRQVKAGKIAPHIPICKSRLLCRHLEKNPSTSEENARLEAVKETFTSDFPFFMSYMRRSIVEKAKPLPVPSKFAKEHFLWRRTNIVLRDAEGQTWKVAHHCKGNRHYFSRGWQAFLYDNELKIGDVCIFEVRNKKEVRVHIYRLPGTSTI